MGKKPRQKNLDPRKVTIDSDKAAKKKEKDWTFEDIARSKTRRR